MPAIVGATLAAVAVVVAVVVLASGGGDQRTVTTAVLDTAAAGATAPAADPATPLGAVLPARIDGWELTATDPGIVSVELADLGAVETAQATRDSEVGLVAGVHPDGEDARVVIERLRNEIGGAPEGTVALGGIAAEGMIQTDGTATMVTFAAPDRAIVTIAAGRQAAVALATAVSEALGPRGTP